MSILQATRHSTLEHGGMDWTKTQWLRALVCCGVCMRLTHHRPQTPISGSRSSGWTECQWCLRATVHTSFCPGRLITPGEMHTSSTGHKSILTHKGSSKLVPVLAAVKTRKKWAKLHLEAKNWGWFSWENEACPSLVKRSHFTTGETHLLVHRALWNLNEKDSLFAFQSN